MAASSRWERPQWPAPRRGVPRGPGVGHKLWVRLEEPTLREALERGRTIDLPGAGGVGDRARWPRRRPESGWDSLTPTERPVVASAAQGLSNSKIAARLFVSRGTVKSHLAHASASSSSTRMVMEGAHAGRGQQAADDALAVTSLISRWAPVSVSDTGDLRQRLTFSHA